MNKSQVLPIACTKEQVGEAKQILQCEIGHLPCKYLGLPLSIRKLTVTDLQPVLDKIADRLPGWKAILLQRSERPILVRAVLTALPIHVLIAIDVPKWIIRAIDKLRRGFLWKGRTDTKGGQCPIAWEWVTRPLHLGGLAIHDLDTLGSALKMRWLWIQKTEPEGPMAHVQVAMPAKARALFEACVTTEIGNEQMARFWTDRWVQGKTLLDLSPALAPFIQKRGWRKRMVA